MATAFRSVFICLLVLLAQSCSFLHDDFLVARVGNRKLYKSEVARHIPKGLLPADSAAMARNYIEKWAGELIITQMAALQLSPKEKDVTREVEEYRNSLLKFRYEQHYLQERLDTVVTEEQIRAAYGMTPHLWELSFPILKARYLSFHKNDKLHDSLLKLLISDDEGDLQLLDSLSRTMVHKFTTFDDRWIDIVSLARYYGKDYGTLIASMHDGIIDIVDGQDENHITFVTDYMQAGNIPPLEYCRDKIRDVIISQRKYALMTTLERNLLDDALEKGDFVIYEANEK